MTVNIGNELWPWGEIVANASEQLRNHPDLPKICIVTPSYNQGPYLEETIRSVLLQSYPRLEYVVMDGGSKDNSVEIIRRYADRITYWESEKDRGQSHAINKGITRCTGDIFNWINSDDLLMPGALWAVARAWIETPGRIIAGHTEYFNERGTFGLAKARGQSLRNFVRFWEADGLEWAQPGTFLPFADLKTLGGVNEGLRYCMDYHMMVRLLARGIEVQCIDQVLARFRFHGTSKTVGSKEDFRLERVPALRQIPELPIKVEDWEWDREQARRLVDVARHVWAQRRYARSMQLFSRALTTSPRGTFLEIGGRILRKINRRPLLEAVPTSRS